MMPPGRGCNLIHPADAGVESWRGHRLASHSSIRRRVSAGTPPSARLMMVRTVPGSWRAPSPRARRTCASGSPASPPTRASATHGRSDPRWQAVAGVAGRSRHTVQVERAIEGHRAEVEPPAELSAVEQPPAVLLCGSWRTRRAPRAARSRRSRRCCSPCPTRTGSRRARPVAASGTSRPRAAARHRSRCPCGGAVPGDGADVPPGNPVHAVIRSG